MGNLSWFVLNLMATRRFLNHMQCLRLQDYLVRVRLWSQRALFNFQCYHGRICTSKGLIKQPWRSSCMPCTSKTRSKRPHRLHSCRDHSSCISSSKTKILSEFCTIFLVASYDGYSCLSTLLWCASNLGHVSVFHSSGHSKHHTWTSFR